MFPFRYVEPAFFSGLLDDPLLLVRVRPEGSHLLFDCGQLHHLAKRLLKGVRKIFISHAHMDHFMGMANFTRNVLVTPREFEIYGPPGIAGRLERLLAGFDWNLAEDFWCDFRVHEISDSLHEVSVLRGVDSFRCEPIARHAIDGDIICSEKHVNVRAAVCDHRIPSLAYRLDEQPAFLIDDNRLAAAGYVRGDWLRELNRRFNDRTLDSGPIKVLVSNNGTTTSREVGQPEALYRDISREETPASIGYVTDIGWDGPNRERLRNLLQGVTLLLCECSYMERDRDKARQSYHLCTSDLNQLLEDIKPVYVMPLHVSKSYIGQTDSLLAEISPPEGTTLLQMPDHVVPRPLLHSDLPQPVPRNANHV